MLRVEAIKERKRKEGRYKDKKKKRPLASPLSFHTHQRTVFFFQSEYGWKGVEVLDCA